LFRDRITTFYQPFSYSNDVLSSVTRYPAVVYANNHFVPHDRAVQVAHLEFLQTKRGTKLLTSGWWGAARKINYTGVSPRCVAVMTLRAAKIGCSLAFLAFSFLFCCLAGF
jgi:hypothetical protein